MPDTNILPLRADTDDLIAQSRAVREYGMTISNALAQRIDALHTTAAAFRSVRASARLMMEAAKFRGVQSEQFRKSENGRAGVRDAIQFQSR